jgi:hypothetical protein
MKDGHWVLPEDQSRDLDLPLCHHHGEKEKVKTKAHIKI